MKNHVVNRFSSVYNPKPVNHESLISILMEIKSDKYKSTYDKCVNAQSKVELENFKNTLPLFTPTGIFNHRSMNGIKEYNGIICLDIDGIDNPNELKEKCKSIDWVNAVFITPSGKGLKVIIQTNATPETYKETELKVAQKFAELTGFARDSHCHDIARIQFLSYDPDIYINENAKIF